MVTLIKVRKDSHNIGKLLLLVELPTSFSYYYPFIFSLWAQGKQATVPIRLLSAHQLTLSISTSNTALDILAGSGDEPLPWSRCAKGTGGPSCQEQSCHPGRLLWPHTIPPHQRQRHIWGRCFPLPSLAQWKTPFTAREECRVQRSSLTLGRDPKYASMVLPPRASEAAKTSLRCINREINVLKCLLSQQ